MCSGDVQRGFVHSSKWFLCASQLSLSCSTSKALLRSLSHSVQSYPTMLPCKPSAVPLCAGARG